MSADLDQDFPQGNPSATFCRLCNQPKVQHGSHGALLCRKCDGSAHLMTPRPR